MTDEKINELLATKVMGWSRVYPSGIVDESRWCSDKDIECDTWEWHPTENVEQVLMCWFKYRNDNKLMGNHADITYRRIAEALAWSKDIENMTLAICNALIEAIGVEDEL